MRKTFLLAGILFIQHSMAQQTMTPELLWKLGRVGGETVLEDGTVVFGVSRYSLEDNKSERNLYSIPLSGGTPKQLTSAPGGESFVKPFPVARSFTAIKASSGKWGKMAPTPFRKRTSTAACKMSASAPTASISSSPARWRWKKCWRKISTPTCPKPTRTSIPV